MKYNQIYQNTNKAFTLAETLVTLVILGIIAVITVSGLIKNQIENANRTKVKKAMASYEKVLNLIIMENDIRSNAELSKFGEEGICDNTRPYFKAVENGDNNCQFKTADGLWWDISNIQKPIISFKKENLTDTQAYSAEYNAFYMYGKFDDNGSLRVNENGYENDYNDYKKAFLSFTGINIINHTFKIWQYLGYEDYKKLNYSVMNICSASECSRKEYDEYGKSKILYSECDLNGKNCRRSTIYEYDENGNMVYSYWGCNGQGKNCQRIQWFDYDQYGNRTLGGWCNLNKQNCDNDFIFTHDENNNETAWYYTCSNKNNTSSCSHVYEYKYNEKNQIIEYYSKENRKVEKYEYDESGTRTARYICDINGNNCQGPYSYRYE